MIVTELYDGQGLGNQLWSYVVTRVLALDKGVDFGIMSPERFKGKDFLCLDFGRPVVGGSGPEGGPPSQLPEGIEHYYAERELWYSQYLCDVREFDQRLLQIVDNTKIEGYFQSERYIDHRRTEICDWLVVSEGNDIRDFSDSRICVMNSTGWRVSCP